MFASLWSLYDVFSNLFWFRVCNNKLEKIKSEGKKGVDYKFEVKTKLNFTFLLNKTFNKE